MLIVPDIAIGFDCPLVLEWHASSLGGFVLSADFNSNQYHLEWGSTGPSPAIDYTTVSFNILDTTYEFFGRVLLQAQTCEESELLWTAEKLFHQSRHTTRVHFVLQDPRPIGALITTTLHEPETALDGPS